MTEFLQPNPWLVGLPAVIIGSAAWFIVVACGWRDSVGWAVIARALVVAGLCWGLATLAGQGVAMLSGKLPEMRSVGDWVSLTSVALSIAVATGFESAVRAHGLRGAPKFILGASLAGRRTRRIVGSAFVVILAVYGFGLYVDGSHVEPPSPVVLEGLGILCVLALTCFCFGLFSGATRAWRTQPRTAWPLLSFALGAAIIATLHVSTEWARALYSETTESFVRTFSRIKAPGPNPSEQSLQQAAELSETFARLLFLFTGEIHEVVTEQGEMATFQPTQDERDSAREFADQRTRLFASPYIAALIAALGALAGARWPRRTLAPAATA
jgi:hypothetical protein